MDYHLVKSQILPRVLQILETSQSLELKLEVLITLKDVLQGIDSQTLKTDVVKSLERCQQKETDPRVCMRML